MSSLFIASFAIFAALYLAPGNPVAALSGGRPLPPGSIRVLDQRYHLTEPFLAHYWYWLGNAQVHRPVQPLGQRLGDGRLAGRLDTGHHDHRHSTTLPTAVGQRKPANCSPRPGVVMPDV